MAIDLNSLVPSLVDVGFELADQIVLPCTYTHTTAGGYNPTTGTSTPTTQTASPGVILTSYKAEEIDGSKVREGDRKAVIKAAELSAITSVRMDDTITVTASGDVWQVKDWKLDPTETVYQMQVRKLE
jgi:hypothetical protein